jgi:hypothetical protein
VDNSKKTIFFFTPLFLFLPGTGCFEPLFIVVTPDPTGRKNK